jgi:hypothetical protein
MFKYTAAGLSQVRNESPLRFTIASTTTIDFSVC